MGILQIMEANLYMHGFGVGCKTMSYKAQSIGPKKVGESDPSLQHNCLKWLSSAYGQNIMPDLASENLLYARNNVIERLAAGLKIFKTITDRPQNTLFFASERAF